MHDETLLFAMLNESGHLNPTFKLARALQTRGHEVRYLATPDMRSHIEAQGFSVVPLFPDLHPLGLLEREQERALPARRRAITQRFRAELARLSVSAPVTPSPALLLVDVTQTQLALWARRAGVPFVYVCTSLPQTRDPGVPPLRSGAPYVGGVQGQVRASLLWRRFVTKRRLGAELAGALGLAPPYQLARTHAPRFGVAPRELDTSTVYMPQLRSVPELVLCPQAFDFPRPPHPGRTYVESLDLARSEPALAWDALSPERPLVYCALGSQRYRADVVPRFFERLVQVFRQRPALQLLLAVGKHMRPDLLPRLPNVHVVARAPQLSALQRARVMITHGGLGSVKECIAHGVPMLGVPLDVDQPGNIARVVHHGLGLAADVARTDTPALLSLLDRLLGEPSFRARTGAMQREFARVEAGTRGVEMVESLLVKTRPTR